MKKILPLVFILFLCSCGKSPEEKAKSHIESFMNKLIPNIKSYEPIQFGSLDSADIKYVMTQEYIDLSRQYEDTKKELEDLNETMGKELKWAKIAPSAYNHKFISEYENKSTVLMNQMNTLSDSILKGMDNFTFDSTMVSMFHSFRFYDEDQKKYCICPITFYFDKDITAIKGIRGLYYGDRGPEIYTDIKELYQ